LAYLANSKAISQHKHSTRSGVSESLLRERWVRKITPPRYWLLRESMLGALGYCQMSLNRYVGIRPDIWIGLSGCYVIREGAVAERQRGWKSH